MYMLANEPSAMDVSHSPASRSVLGGIMAWKSLCSGIMLNRASKTCMRS